MLEGAKLKGETIKHMDVSRTICSGCADALKKNNVSTKTKTQSSSNKKSGGDDSQIKLFD